MATQQLPAHMTPMPPAKRMSLAVTISLAFHIVVVLLLGVWSLHSHEPSLKLVPVEVTMLEPPKPEPPPTPAVVVASPEKTQARYQTQLPAKPVVKPVEQTAIRPLKPSKNRRPSNAGGSLDRAPAAPHILTAKSGRTPAGPVGHGTATDGPGGKVEEPGGPTYGPNTAGGPLPIYPKRALDVGLEGRVILSVTVSADGAITEVTVAKSSGQQVLDDAAIRAVRRGWAFKPGMAKGKPAAGTARVVFEFSAGKVR